jgi:hypothetical protein
MSAKLSQTSSSRSKSNIVGWCSQKVSHIKRKHFFRKSVQSDAHDNGKRITWFYNGNQNDAILTTAPNVMPGMYRLQYLTRLMKDKLVWPRGANDLTLIYRATFESSSSSQCWCNKNQLIQGYKTNTWYNWQQDLTQQGGMESYKKVRVP